MQKLQDWQVKKSDSLTNMVQNRNYTVEEFHKWRNSVCPAVCASFRPFVRPSVRF